jgi:hypothetical protein
MYFWRIEKMKSEMAARPLSEREALPYFVVWVALSSVIPYLPQKSQNAWVGLEALLTLLFTALGTIYIYHRNGGANGQHFLQRYFAIGWVVGMRWMAVLFVATVVFYLSLRVGGGDPEGKHWSGLLFYAAAMTALYWRIGHHVGDLAQRASITLK